MGFSVSPDEREQALADVDTAREVVKATRRRVTQGEDGHSALTTAEYRLAGAIERARRCGALDDRERDAP